MTVATYSNADGSFDWTSEHINIRAYAMNKVFKVRFHAMGMNSLNILRWFVDNIHVYHVCEGATELTSDIDYGVEGIVLNWIGPGGPGLDEWIHWDDGTNFTSIGTGGTVEFDVAARWEPSQLTAYEGASVTEVAFFPAEAQCTYNIRIWTGAGAANLVLDQPVSSPAIGQ